MRTCSTCGTVNPPSATSCSQCGMMLSDPMQPFVGPPVPQPQPFIGPIPQQPNPFNFQPNVQGTGQQPSTPNPFTFGPNAQQPPGPSSFQPQTGGPQDLTQLTDALNRLVTVLSGNNPTASTGGGVIPPGTPQGGGQSGGSTPSPWAGKGVLAATQSLPPITGQPPPPPPTATPTTIPANVPNPFPFSQNTPGTGQQPPPLVIQSGGPPPLPTSGLSPNVPTPRAKTQKPPRGPRRKRPLHSSITNSLSRISTQLTNVHHGQGAPTQIGGLLGIGGGVVGDLQKSADPKTAAMLQAVQSAIMLPKVLLESVDKLREWNNALFQSNMRFANFSASMSQVQAQQEIRRIYYEQERGEARAESAGKQAEAKQQLDQSLAPIEDKFANFTNELSTELSKATSQLVDALTESLGLSRGSSSGNKDKDDNVLDWVLNYGRSGSRRTN